MATVQGNLSDDDPLTKQEELRGFSQNPSTRNVPISNDILKSGLSMLEDDDDEYSSESKSPGEEASDEDNGTPGQYWSQIPSTLHPPFYNRPPNPFPPSP